MARFMRNINLIDNCRLVLSNSTRYNQLMPIENLSTMKKVNTKLRELNLPERPKRPLTGYLKFFKEHRQKLLEKNPNLKVVDLVKQCALDWKQIDEKTKNYYMNEYKQELENFVRKVKQYKDNLTDEQQEKIKTIEEKTKKETETRKIRKRNKENDKPKRPIGAYTIFVMEEAKNSDKHFKDLLVTLKEKWQELPETSRQKYIEEAKKAKIEYDNELAKWEKKMISEGKYNLVRKKIIDKVVLPPTNQTKGHKKEAKK